VAAKLRFDARHLNLLWPEMSEAPPTGPVTMNFTEIYLDGLTNQELDVLERLLERKQVVDQQRGLGPALEPRFGRTHV
jgi:hypothetical protein